MAVSAGTEREFVEQWGQWYSYTADELYTTNIGRELTAESIHALFLWKNGGELSSAKYASVERHYASRYKELSRLPDSTSAEDFLQEFGGGAIWRIFLLHCWRPRRFPIYDQHVHRAMEYLLSGEIIEIPSVRDSVMKSYVERYVPFWTEFSSLPDRDVDKALWAFGKFLKQKQAPRLLSRWKKRASGWHIRTRSDSVDRA